MCSGRSDLPSIEKSVHDVGEQYFSFIIIEVLLNDWACHDKQEEVLLQLELHAELLDSPVERDSKLSACLSHLKTVSWRWGRL